MAADGAAPLPQPHQRTHHPPSPPPAGAVPRLLRLRGKARTQALVQVVPQLAAAGREGPPRDQPPLPRVPALVHDAGAAKDGRLLRSSGLLPRQPPSRQSFPRRTRQGPNLHSLLLSLRTGKLTSHSRLQVRGRVPGARGVSPEGVRGGGERNQVKGGDRGEQSGPVQHRVDPAVDSPAQGLLLPLQPHRPRAQPGEAEPVQGRALAGGRPQVPQDPALLHPPVPDPGPRSPRTPQLLPLPPAPPRTADPPPRRLQPRSPLHRRVLPSGRELRRQTVSQLPSRQIPHPQQGIPAEGQQKIKKNGRLNVAVGSLPPSPGLASSFRRMRKGGVSSA